MTVNNNIIFNLFFIKSKNGLYYYALDIYANLRTAPKIVLVRGDLEVSARNDFPNSHIIVCNLFQFIIEAFLAWKSDIYIFTPSSHPLPFISKQMVVLHDTYPFLFWKGFLKKWLFITSARTSMCSLAHINIADGFEFYKKYNFELSRLVFFPNKFTGEIATYQSERSPNQRKLIVGLVGTDSSKKNYSDLFQAVRNEGAAEKIVFEIFGHLNDYIRNLHKKFPDIDVNVNDSDSINMSHFLASVDAVVSVAINEGFGRPIASALESGIPCYLIDNLIFREFFESGAIFSADTRTLLKTILIDWESNNLKQIYFNPKKELTLAFTSALKTLPVA